MSHQNILLCRKKFFFRLDVLPFLFIYLGSFFYLPEDEIYAKLGFLAVILLNCIAYLTNFWSVRANSVIEYFSIQTAQKNLPLASHVRVRSEKKGRNTTYAICKLEKTKIGETEVYYFHFHNKKYLWDNDKKDFRRIKPHVEETLHYYKAMSRMPQEELSFYDKNTCEIPAPEFKNLLKDQLIEPFSFFQFFTVSLWLMDENRLYPLFTLVMIFMSSCIVTFQRMRTMNMLRSMVLSPQYIYVYREHKWVKINSIELTPGDICAIQTSNNISVVEAPAPAQPSADNVPFARFLSPAMREQIHQQMQQQMQQRQAMIQQQQPQRQAMIQQQQQQRQAAIQQRKKEQEENQKVLPCDFVILSGGCVVNESILTGESIPQIKDSIENLTDDKDTLDIKSKHKTNVLFCGTEVIQTFPNLDKLPEGIQTKPPVPCVIGYALRTGFETAKGKLTRTVLFNNENLNIKQGEAFFLIGVLLIFSIWSSVNILLQGLEDPDRDKNKLFLRCILIITTVVPPELPMILSIAVNSSLVYLQRKKIFCTEPFRIPYAGKISICAFDKTGTLTKDELIFRGIVENIGSGEPEIKLTQESINSDTLAVLAGCHSLVTNQGKLLGDPIEKALYEAYNWKYSHTEKLSQFGKGKARIVQLNPFQAELKRMSTVISYSVDDVHKDFRVVVKGAPETIEKLLKEVPSNYEKVFRNYAKKGFRVLALAHKTIPSLQEMTREEAESKLTFAGFILFDSPLKKDTKKQITVLLNANYKVIMITGDSELTAANVNDQLDIGPKAHLFLNFADASEKTFAWFDDDGKKCHEFNTKNLSSIQKDNTLCMTGNVLKALTINARPNEVSQVIRSSTVFARVSPSQKEYIVFTLKSAGERVLMCGDGTNDVGALKKSDVGLALVGLNDPPVKTEESRRQARAEKQRSQFQQMQQGDIFAGDGPSFKPGDASIAAPFTSKHSNSTVCVPIVLKQGVCTLVTTFQTYKILAMTCLIQAYSMSALHTQKTKFSETQSTLLGILGAANYYFYSNAKPVKTLSKIKPPTTILEPYFIFSVAGQVIVQLWVMDYLVREIGLKHSSEDEIKLLDHEDFKPTLINTVVFLHNIVGQTIIFLFNYGGKPFMESLSDNKKYLKILLIALGSSLLLAFNIIDDFNHSMDLTFGGISQDVINDMGTKLVLMVVISYVYEKLLKFLKFRKFFDYL